MLTGNCPPKMLTFAQIYAAHKRMAPHLLPTPLLKSEYLSDLIGGCVYLKLENQQLLNAFKIRGMVNKFMLLNERERQQGVMVASSGNHGIAASYCGRCWDTPVEVFVPITTPTSKIERIKHYGAKLYLVGENYDEAHAYLTQQLQHNPHKVYIDSSSDSEAIAGVGTLGLEIVAEVPHVDAILVPVGGGGLITGVGLAAKSVNPDIKMIGVQTEACPAMLASLRDGVIYKTYATQPSVCEALVGGIGELGFQFASQCIDKVVTTKESSIKKAMLTLLLEERVLAEASGAIGVAHVSENPYLYEGQELVIIISGGNVSIPLLTDQLNTL